MFDVAIIGGGPAGLQAALTLGRMHRTAVLIDGGRYRNDRADAMHNLVTHDGRPPAELRAAARRDLEAYDTIATREARVDRVTGRLGAFTLTLDDGGMLEAGRLILATGVADALPDIPGLPELFGSVAAHCPFCHGHEFAGTAVAIIGAQAHAPRQALMMRPIAAEVFVLPHEDGVDAELDAQLRRTGATVRAGRIARIAAAPGGAEVAFDDGSTLRVGGLLVTTRWTQAAPFAAELGLETSAVGAITVDALARTSVPGVYAAGDAAVGPGLPGPMHAVGLSIAAGLTAGSAVVHDLVAEELAG